MRPRLLALLLLGGLALATRFPVAEFGRDHVVGRIDAWAIHGLSPARVDGLGDPPQFALAVFFAGSALVAVGRPGALRVAGRAGAVLAAFVLLRVASHAGLGVAIEPGVVGLGVMALAGGVAGGP